MRNKIDFETLRELLLFRRIVKWEGNKIVLDNDICIAIEETEHDCCACASGSFVDVVLDAAITNVSDIEYEPWMADDKWSDGEYGCKARVTIMHNQNLICKAVADADAGNGGYYYSIASFIVKVPNMEEVQCHFVGSNDGREEDK